MKKHIGSIEALQAELTEFAKARDWEQYHSPKNLVMALSVTNTSPIECHQVPC